jgi:ATP-binding cassette subfamily C protein
VARALAPVELTIANWKSFVSARQSWRRLTDLLGALTSSTEPMALPPPKGSLAIENVSGAPPGVQRLVVQDISFTLKAGQGLGIVGPSASGKSSLARLLVGVWTPVRGKVRIDGAAMDQWAPAALGNHIGYLPQDVELFAGTVAQNISRFDPDAPSEAIIAAAKAAGVHDMIVRLAEGYETQVGEGGAVLSAGQRQRIALARALYRDPFLVVLDEPNSNLDGEGDNALTQAIAGVRKRGGIVIVVAHRRSALAAIDQVLLLQQGRQQALGPRDEILAKIGRPQQSVAPAPMAAAAGAGAAAPLRLVAEPTGSTS